MALSLHEAAKSGNLEEVKRLIQQDPQLVNCRGNGCFGYTPLHYASCKGHVGVAAWLLRHGAHSTR